MDSGGYAVGLGEHVPSVGGYLMPIAMNVAHFILFGASTCLMLAGRRTTWAAL